MLGMEAGKPRDFSHVHMGEKAFSSKSEIVRESKISVVPLGASSLTSSSKRPITCTRSGQLEFYSARWWKPSRVVI